MDKDPSIAIWIDAETQEVTVKFKSQPLSPAEYGLVIASMVVHIARLFAETNPQAGENMIILELQKGIAVGLAQRQDIVLPHKPH